MQRIACGQCGRDNRVIAHYCGDCGALLARALPAPGHRHIPEVYDHLDEQLCLVMKHVALSDQFDLPESLALALMNIGCVHYEQGQLDTAEGRLDLARQIFSRIGVRDEESHCLYVLGDIALRQGDSATAEGHGQHALDLATQISSTVFMSCALRVRGEARLAIGDLAAAAADPAESGRLQQASGDPYDAALIQAAQAHLARAQGDPARAHAEAARAFARERGSASTCR